MMIDNVEGKIVLITGGGTGIGAAIAGLMSARHAKVVIAGRRPEKLKAVCSSLNELGYAVWSYVVDVTRPKEFANLVAAVERDIGPLDVLVNNAGVMFIRPMIEGNIEEWNTMIDVNIKGTLNGIAAVLPSFIDRRKGHIINMCSVAGIKVFSPGGSVYSGTKFAIRAISEGLRIEVGDAVRVTSIEPGIVESDLKFATNGAAAAHVLEAYKIAIPASAVARAVVFAIEQPDNVDVNEIVVRPTIQEH
jgi:NADP-dependent 3-hydroxy acid dehydrogenase YdfG